MLPIHFAPLQGYTEAPYRNAHNTAFGGIETYHAPFVRIDRGEFRHKDVRDVEPDNNMVSHLIPQLIAPNAEKADKLVNLFLEKGYREASINLGCPFPMLAKRHNGSGILPYPEEVKELLSIVNQYPEMSFSVKMRLGWENPEECLALAPLLNDLPLKAITLHPRLGIQQYKGTVDLKGFEDFYNLCQQPLIYNGDLCTTGDIQQIEARFPRLSGVMIGRGLLANPALALEYKENRTLTDGERKQKLKEMHTLVFARYEDQIEGGDTQLLNKMQSFWEYLEPQIGHKVWKAIKKSTTLQKYQVAVQRAFN